MAGVDPNAGMDAETMSVPSIGGDAEIAEARNLNNDHRNNGVAYNETPGVDVTTKAYPEGTDVGEANNPLKP